MDSNNMYQNQQGTEPDNNQAYQDGYYQGGYTQEAGSQGAYSQGSYQNNYNQGNYNQNYQNTNYQNTNYQQNPYQNYNGNYQPSQLDLEEPVKMSEWLISFLILMVPCVNIIMMFVWAFSQTEKKSKSNFFKAYLIMFGILFAIYIVVIILIVALGLSDSWYSWYY